jgi:hypothetical protein
LDQYTSRTHRYDFATRLEPKFETVSSSARHLPAKRRARWPRSQNAIERRCTSEMDQKYRSRCGNHVNFNLRANTDRHAAIGRATAIVRVFSSEVDAGSHEEKRVKRRSWSAILQSESIRLQSRSAGITIFSRLAANNKDSRGKRSRFERSEEWLNTRAQTPAHGGRGQALTDTSSSAFISFLISLRAL